MKIELRERRRPYVPDLYFNDKRVGFVSFVDEDWEVSKQRFIDALASLQEPEPKYLYEVKVEDTEIGKTYMFVDQLQTRITHTCHPDSELLWFVDANYYACAHLGNVIILSSTDPNTCTVGELEDLKLFKTEDVLCRRIFRHKDDMYKQSSYRNEETKCMARLDNNTPCVKIPDPKNEKE